MTEPIVSQEPVSVTEPVLQTNGEGQPVQTTEPVKTPEPLTLEVVQKMIAEETAKAVALAKETGRRELQSQQDKNRAEQEGLTRRVRLAEGALGETRKQVQLLDPEVAKTLELAELRAREAGRLTLEQEAQVNQQQTAYAQSLQTSLETHLKSLGIDVTDARIDWAADAGDYVSGRSRFDTSVAKIIKEQAQSATSTLEKRLKELEAKVNGAETNEANSVSTATSSGVVSDADSVFLSKFGNGEIPMTKENMARANKLMT